MKCYMRKEKEKGTRAMSESIEYVKRNGRNGREMEEKVEEM